MKKIIMISLIVLTIKTFGQTPNWFWAHSAGGNFNDNGTSVANDSTGNVYVTGSFYSSTITFGSITLINANPSTADIFIAKYDPAGNVLWAKEAGGSGRDDGNGITTDANGNVFITGEFYSSSINFGTTTLINSASFKTFTAKYDPSGNVLWAKSSGGSGSDVAKGIASDTAGNVFITGYFGGSITFGTTTLTNSSSTVFTVKYNASGNVLWAKAAIGDFSDNSNKVATDAVGNAFITGAFVSSSITFGSITLSNAGSGGTTDIFLVKYDPLGNVLWAKKAGAGFYYDEAYSVSADPSGNAIITGFFSAPLISFGSTTLTNGGAKDFFVVKYSPLGNVIWAKSQGDASDDIAVSTATDPSGNIYVTGSFASSTFTVGTTTLTNSGSKDIFVIKYSPTGSVLWACSAGGSSSDSGAGLSVDTYNNLFITGAFQSATIPFGSMTLTNAGTTAYFDAFVANLSTITNILTIKTEESFSIAPNPFTLSTTIKFSDNQKNSTIRILDILGNEIQTMNFSGKEFTIEKGFLEKGIYILQAIDDSNSISNKKIIIQ